MGAGVSFSLHGDTQDPYEVAFSKPGPQDTSMSEAYPVRRAFRVYSGYVSLPVSVTATSILTVYINGVTVDAITVPAGAAFGSSVFVPNSGEAGARVSVAWTTNPPVSGCTVILDLV